MKIEVEWCGYHLNMAYDPQVDVHMRSEPESIWGLDLRLRVGVGFGFVPYGGQSYRDPRSMTSPLLIVESWYWRFLHAEAHVGLQTYGAGIGIDLTRNLDLYSGIGIRWRSFRQVTPLLALSVAIN
jgi:hypothetical protein